MDHGTDERALLRSLAAGDRSAGERLVEGTYRKVYGALFKLTGGDADLAADLTQDTYRKAWASLDGFRGKSSFSTWLYRIAYTTFLKHLRRPRPVLSTDDEGGLDPVADGRPGPRDDLLARDEAATLRRAVLDLPERLRFTVTARYWGELPAREIARLEAISTTAVNKRLSKARSILRLALEDTA